MTAVIYRRPGAVDNALAVRCRHCKARPGRPCVNVARNHAIRDTPHPSRRLDAQGGTHG